MTLKSLYLDLNSFFASAEQQLQPALRGRPVAVVPALTDATCAIAASYEAKTFGIKTGTKIYEAKRLCPDLVCVPANHEKYVYYHERIARCIEKHIPIHKAESIDEFSCILDPSQQNEAESLALARRIKKTISDELGPYLRSSIGIGPNRFLAKTASNLEKPDGLQILHASDMPARMANAHPSELVGIGGGMSKRLERSGIVTVEQLYALPLKQMRAIWGGVGGERFYHTLRGVELPETPTQKRTVGHSHVLEPQWRPAERSEAVLRRLLLKATSRLRQMDYMASALTVNLRVEDGPRISAEARFAPCCDSLALQAHLLASWQELMRRYGPKRLKKISVTLHHLSPADGAQLSLFDETHATEIQRRKRAEQLSRAMDSLNHRFGRDTISLGSLPRQVRCFSGTKVAFTRIPQSVEFHE